jgi:putative NADH-flavin reductase
VQVRLADARNKTETRVAISGSDAVVNAIGAGTLRRNDVESTTTDIAVTAAQEVGVERYIAISAGMVALDWMFFKYVLCPLIFRNIFAEHCRVEKIVKASALAWTIVRPPRLTNGPPRGYVASLELQPRSFSAARADVAAFIADEVENKAYIRQAVFIASRRTQ